MTTTAGENLLDGVPRTPLIPQVEAGNWDNFSFQNLKMYRDLYDAIAKTRNGELTLIDPKTSPTYNPTTANNLTTKKYVDNLILNVEITPGDNYKVYQSLGGVASWGLVTEDNITLADVVTNNVSISAHGLCPILSGSEDDVLRGDGTWGTGIPAGTGQYKVLQLDGDDEPVWDYPRGHA